MTLCLQKLRQIQDLLLAATPSQMRIEVSDFHVLLSRARGRFMEVMFQAGLAKCDTVSLS